MEETYTNEVIKEIWETSLKSIEHAVIDPRGIPTHKLFETKYEIDDDNYNILVRRIRKGWDNNQPVLIAKIEDDFFLMDGYSRRRAAIKANIHEITFIVKKYDNVKDVLKEMEGIQVSRRNLKESDRFPIAQSSIAEGIAKGTPLTGPDLAKIIGVSNNLANKYLKVINLGTEVMIENILSGETNVHNTYKFLSENGYLPTRQKLNPEVKESPVKPPKNSKPKSDNEIPVKKTTMAVNELEISSLSVKKENKVKDIITIKSIKRKLNDLEKNALEKLSTKSWTFEELHSIYMDAIPKIDRRNTLNKDSFFTSLAKSVNVDL